VDGGVREEGDVEVGYGKLGEVGGGYEEEGDYNGHLIGLVNTRGLWGWGKVVPSC